MSSDNGDFVAIPIGAFMRGIPLQVDSFIALNDEKHVMVFKAGTPVDFDRLNDYQEKRLTALHLRKEDCESFFASQLLMAHKALSFPKLLPEQKMHFLNLAHQVLITKMDTLGFCSESFESAKWCARSVLNLAQSENGLMNLIEKIQGASQHGLNHAMAVAMVAVMLGRSMGWTRPDTLEKLALGGILHDVGLSQVSSHLRGKPEAEMTPGEVREYRSHVEHGVRMLASVPAVPSDVIAIAQEHHENALGQGYPRQVRDLKINPLARIVGLADAFCELILVSDVNPAPLSPSAALVKMEAVMGQPFNKEAFRKLRALVIESKEGIPRSA